MLVGLADSPLDVQADNHGAFTLGPPARHADGRLGYPRVLCEAVVFLVIRDDILTVAVRSRRSALRMLNGTSSSSGYSGSLHPSHCCRVAVGRVDTKVDTPYSKLDSTRPVFVYKREYLQRRREMQSLTVRPDSTRRPLVPWVRRPEAGPLMRDASGVTKEHGTTQRLTEQISTTWETSKSVIARERRREEWEDQQTRVDWIGVEGLGSRALRRMHLGWGPLSCIARFGDHPLPDAR